MASIRYDLAGGGRDIRETFSYTRSYTSIVSTTVTEITQIVGSSTVVIDNRSDDHGECRRCSGGDDDDDLLRLQPPTIHTFLILDSFFLSGLPGGLSYVMLVMVKEGKMAKLDEKR